VSDSVQGDGLEEQVAAGSPLCLNHKMIPGVVLGIARNPCRYPLLVNIVPGVPLMAASDPAFVPPNVAFSILGAKELIDVEFKGLRRRQAVRVKVNVVCEVMSVVNERVVGVRKALSGKISHEVVVPQNVGIRMCAPDRMFGGVTAQGRGRNAPGSAPIHRARSGRAGTADRPSRSEEGIAWCPAVLLQVCELVIIRASGLSKGSRTHHYQTKSDKVLFQSKVSPAKNVLGLRESRHGSTCDQPNSKVPV